MVSCACPPLHPHPSRVDLVLLYNLYLTTVMSSCSSFPFLLLFHLGCACVKGACLTCDCISPGRSRFISSCRLVFTLPGSQSLAALQHRLCAGQGPPRVAQHAATSPKCPSPPCLTPCCLCSQALRRSALGLSSGQERVAEFVGALLPLRPALGCSSAAGGSHIQQRRHSLPPFFLLQAPCSVPLSVEWGFSALPPPVKLGASTTYYCSPPFRASLEALSWESEFLQLFVLVRADSSPSRVLD